MSSARGRASKRDLNEPEIRKRFKAHGWHTETLSAPGMPDLLAFAKMLVHANSPFQEPAHRTVYLVDVKGDTGKPTPAQDKKWRELDAAGIPVYVCRTKEDVDALVAGTLDAWEPETRDVDAFARRLSSGTTPGQKSPHAAMSATFDEEMMKRVAAKFAREEEARIPERAAAELKRRGK